MFLASLYKKWKALFVVVVLFIIGQAYFMWKGIQNAPFFLFYMFSTPHAKNSLITDYTIEVNGRPFKPDLINRERESLYGSLEYFRSLSSRNFYAVDTALIQSRLQGRLPQGLYARVAERLVNKIDSADYTLWLRRYLQQLNHAPVRRYEVKMVQSQWTDGVVRRVDTLDFLQYHE